MALFDFCTLSFTIETLIPLWDDVRVSSSILLLNMFTYSLTGFISAYVIYFLNDRYKILWSKCCTALTKFLVTSNIPAPGLTSRAILRLSRVNVVLLQCLDHHYSCAILPFASLFSHSFTFLTLFGEPGPREAGFLQLRES
jgi:hypothetical protein